MKRTIKLALLACLILLVGTLTLTACDITDFIPSPNGTTTEVTTPKETTAPEETTTPKEITTPETTTPEPHVHTVAIDAAVAPTCTTSGLTEGKHCATCFEVLVERKSVPALGHTEITNIAIAPTCTTDGKTEGKYCSVCGEILAKQEIVKALGHTEVVDQAVAPTCTATGLTEGKHCSDCNNVLVAQKVLRPNGHSFGEWYTIKESTETEKGEKRRDCGSCDGFETSPIAELAHNHNNWDVIVLEAVAPNCTETGLTEGKQCSGCNEILVAQTIVPALGHELGEWETSVPPHCYFYGWDYANCTRCDTYSEWREIEPTGHTEVIDNAVAPTCTKTGLTEGKHCSACGETLVAQTIVYALGHSFGEWTQTLAPTCTEKGGERRDCSVCEYFETREISANGHTNNEAVIENKIDATCTMHGSYDSVVYCSVCNSEVSRNIQIIRHLGHSFGEWTQTLAPTCTEKGSERRDCSVCEHFETREINANGHSNKEAVVENKIDATCTTDGSYDSVVYCSVCNSEVSRNIQIIGHLGHNYNSIVTPPTVTTAGYTTHTCSACGDTYTDNHVPPTGSIGLLYVVNADGTSCTITGIGTCTDTEICISATIDGYTVTAIGDKAFAENAAITKIILPDTITTIGRRAFYKCTEITEFTVPESVTSIGTQIFYGCDKLTTVYYNGQYGNSENPFLSVKNLETVVFGGASIPNYVANNATALKTIIILDSVKTIGESAFKGCSSLTTITIPDSVTSIGSSALSGCSSLESITLPFVGSTRNGTSNPHFGYIFGATYYDYNKSYVPATLKNVVITGCTSIGNYAFYKCSNLISITIPDSVTSIGYYAFYNCSSLTSINIPDGVTSIGSDTFCGCSSLTSINIPNGVTSIGNYAFYGCSSLTSITIPDSVTTIGSDAFYGCSELTDVYATIENWMNISFGNYYARPTRYGALHILDDAGNEITEITIPNTVTIIDDSTFAGCKSLTSITIPNSVTKIGDYAFEGCNSLSSITVPDSVMSIGDSAFFGCSNLTSITIPDSVISIGSSAFSSCSSLTSIIIPDSVTSIGSYAFNGCSGLTSITIPDSVTSIGYAAFYGCSSLISITIPDSVTSISNSTFYNCSSLISITIPDSVMSIGNYAFYGCSSLTSITIPNSVTSIGWWAFAYCSSLTNITIGDGVTSIDEYTFYSCNSLTSVTIGNNVASIGDGAFSGCYKLVEIYNLSPSISIKKGSGNYGYIGYYALDVYNSIEEASKLWTDASGYIFYEDGDIRYLIGYTGRKAELTLPATCNGKKYEIFKDAFYNRGNLVNVTIPDGVTSIGTSAFSYCSRLTNVTIGNGVTSIGSYAFENCSNLTNVTIGNGVTSIGYSAFSYCSSLMSITIPNSVANIGDWAFRNCYKLVEVYNLSSSISITKGSEDHGYLGYYALNVYNSIEEASKIWTDANGYVFYEDGDACYLVDYVGSDTELILPTSCNGKNYLLNQYVFDYCRNLTSITIPSNITIISDGTFRGCSSLTSITIPDSVTSIGDHAFRGCSSLTSITMPDSVTSIGDSAFEGCSSLTSITIPDSVTSIGSYAFSACRSMTSITIPDSVTSIGSRAFSDCYSLTSITIPNSVTNIGSYAFDGCWGLIQIEDEIYYVDKWVIGYDEYGYDDITSVTLREDTIGICDYLFAWCEKLTEITIPNSVKYIGNSAFYDCNSLTSIMIPNNVTHIGNEAFYSCDNLTFIEMSDSITHIGNDAFGWCDDLQSIAFWGTVEQWNTIEFGENWINGSGSYYYGVYVSCNDGSFYVK